MSKHFSTAIWQDDGELTPDTLAVFKHTSRLHRNTRKTGQKRYHRADGFFDGRNCRNHESFIDRNRHGKHVHIRQKDPVH